MANSPFDGLMTARGKTGAFVVDCRAASLSSHNMAKALQMTLSERINGTTASARTSEFKWCPPWNDCAIPG